MRHTRATAAALGALLTLSAEALAQDHAPRLLEAPAVSLPADGSLPDGASVRLELTIDATGAVTEATVIEPLRDDIDAQVLAAARAMRFEPASRGGQSVPARVRFRFRLQAPPRASTPDTPPPAPPSPIPPNPYVEGAPEYSPPAQPTPPTTSTSGDGDVEGEATIRVRREPGAATVMTLRGEELTTVPGTLGEPTRVVATMPGVSRSPFGLGLFVVRGASFENTGFFIDGFPVPVLYHFGFGPAVISSRLVGQLDFYPGGYPLEYGRFSAGVISLQTRPPPSDRPFLEFQVDVLRAAVMGVVPFDHGRGSIAVAARRSYYELLAPLFVDGVNLSYSDYQVRADYRFSARSRVSLFVFGSQDTFDRSAAAGVGQTASEQNTSLTYTFHRMIGRWDYTLPHRMQLSISGMAGVDDVGSTSQVPGMADQSFASTGFILGERASLKVPTGRYLTTTLGLDVLTISFDADLRVPLPDSIGGVPPPAFDPTVVAFRPRISQLSIATYIEEALRVGPVELTAGLRMDRLIYAAVDTTVADPRMVMRYRFGPRVTAQVASGFFPQAPPFFQLVPEVRNPRLRPQRSWQSSAGVELTLPAHIEARLTGFYTRMYNLQRTTNETINTPDGPERLNVADDGQGRSYGMEVLIRRRLERGVYGWVSYTLSRSERFVEGGAVVPFPFDQTHVLNVALSWNINTHWRVGARFQLATGNPRRIITGSYYDADRDNYRPTYNGRTDDGSDLERLPVYHQLDVRVDYRFRAGPLRMSAYLDVINAYYAQNTENWLYQYDFARRTGFPGLPILPAIGLTGEL
ncbi:MAG: TonB family protein [Polyangiales bacterium]